MTPEDAIALPGHKDLIKVLDYLQFMLKDSRSILSGKVILHYTTICNNISLIKNYDIS